MNPNNERWTQANIELLKRLHAQCLSPGQIANSMSQTTGMAFTRNMIIGKFGREGLKSLYQADAGPPKPRSFHSGAAPRDTVKVTKPSGLASGVRPPGVATGEVPLPDPGAIKRWDSTPPEDANPKSIVALKYIGECKWPLAPSDDGVMMFCGARSQDGCVYCGTHMRRSIGLSYVRPARPVQAVTG